MGTDGIALGYGDGKWATWVRPGRVWVRAMWARGGKLGVRVKADGRVVGAWHGCGGARHGAVDSVAPCRKKPDGLGPPVSGREKDIRLS